MKLLRIAIAALCWCGIMACVWAQPILKYYEFKSGEEMNHSRVACYVQDEKGILWLGTWIGLCRYDGQQFRYFRSEPGNDNPLTSNRIVSMELDSQGHLWCVTNDSKVYRFNRETSSFVAVMPLVSERNLPVPDARKGARSIYALEQNKVTWMVLRDGTCVRFSDKNIAQHEVISVEGYGKTRHISTIFADSKGREWILSDRGTMIYNGPTLSEYPFSQVAEVQGRVFLMSNDGYLAEYEDNDQLRFVNLPKTIQSIYNMTPLQNDWLALSTNAGLVLYMPQSDSVTICNRTTDGQRAMYDVENIREDSRGRLWCFSLRHDGVFCYDLHAATLEWHPNPGPFCEKNQVISLHLMMEDGGGNVWLKPTHGNLCWYDEEQRRLRPYEDAMPKGASMPINSYNACFVDHQKNLWISSGTKLYRFSSYPRQFQYKPLPNIGEVRALLHDGPYIWYGDKNEGYLCRTTLDTCQPQYLAPSGQWTTVPVRFSTHGIYALMRDTQGVVWVGTRGDGLYRLAPQDDSTYGVQHFVNGDGMFDLSNDDIYDIYEDECQHIWIATFEGGLNLVDRRWANVRFIHCKSKLLNYPKEDYQSVRCVDGDGKGNIMVGTSDGLITFKSEFSRPAEITFNTSVHKPLDATSLPNNIVMQVLNSPDGTNYACTYGMGISRIESEDLAADSLKFHTILNRDYPAGDVTIAAEVDSLGRVWYVSESGITCYDPQTHTLRYFDDTDFDHSYTFNETHPLILPDGRIVLGAQGGVMVFDSNTLSKSDFSPEIVFTGVKYPGDSGERILFNDLDTLTLNPRHRSVNIQFAALDYRPSRLMRYAYKTDEVDDEWTYTTTPVVNYVNLPAGNFSLLVRSTNSDGVWCDNQRELLICVEPTFWETPWASVFYVLCFFALLALVVWIYTYIYGLRHKVDLERKMAQVKLNFFTDISHELRTPLTLIDGPLSDVLAQEPLSKQARGHLELARKNTVRMLELVNQILDFRKVQTRHVRLSLIEQDMVELVKSIKHYFSDLAKENNIDYRLLSSVTDCRIWVDADKVEKILFNLLSNAFKYTEKGRSITIELGVNEQKVWVAVTDQGRGIEPSRISSIFDRFVSLSDGKNMQPSSGVGLGLVKELVQLHHAHISVESTPGQGSRFCVEFSRDIEVYKSDPLVDFVVVDKTEKIVAGNQAETFVAASSTATEQTVSTMTTNKPARPITILVVEDNDELRRFIVEILESDYRVREARDGAEGLSIVKSEEIDFILTDVMMPGMDGMEMVRRIKSDPQICHVPIVVLSAKSTIDDRIEGLEQGIDDYLTKPFSATYLRVRVANLISQRKMLQQSFLASCLSDTPHKGSTAAETPQDEVANASVSSIELQAPQVVDYDLDFMRKVMGYFEENMSNSDLAIADLADAVNMSRTTFYRKLKSIVGLSPVDFVRQIRIRRAVQLINLGEESLSQIAYRVGFSDPKYFSKCFKRDMGMPPLEYRQKVQNNKTEQEPRALDDFANICEPPTVS